MKADDSITVKMQAGLQHVDDMYAIADVSLPTLGLVNVRLAFDVPTMRLVLIAACGCHVYYQVANLLLGLSEHLDTAHPKGAPHGTQTH